MISTRSLRSTLSLFGCVPLALGSWHITGTAESSVDKDSAVPLMHYDPTDLGSVSSAEAPSVGKNGEKNGEKERDNGEIKKSGACGDDGNGLLFFSLPTVPRALSFPSFPAPARFIFFPSPISPLYRKDERDLCGGERSWIADPDQNHPTGTHSNMSNLELHVGRN